MRRELRQPPQLQWRGLGDPPLQPERRVALVRAAIEPWIGTPYRSGQRVAGERGGVDCIRFACAVLDRLLGAEAPTVLPQNLPLDTSLHAPATARAAMRRLLRLYPMVVDVPATEDGGRYWEVQPGDVVVTGPLHGGPGHLVVVGWEPSTCWEATPPRVRKIGAGLDPRAQHVFRVFRPWP